MQNPRGEPYGWHKRPYPHGHGGKMRVMQLEEAILSRWQFLKLCVASMAGMSLISLVWCGGSQGGNPNNKKDNGIIASGGVPTNVIG